jgi:hypothetical protein
MPSEMIVARVGWVAAEQKPSFSPASAGFPLRFNPAYRAMLTIACCGVVDIYPQ